MRWFRSENSRDYEKWNLTRDGNFARQKLHNNANCWFLRLAFVWNLLLDFVSISTQFFFHFLSIVISGCISLADNLCRFAASLRAAAARQSRGFREKHSDQLSSEHLNTFRPEFDISLIAAGGISTTSSRFAPLALQTWTSKQQNFLWPQFQLSR